MDILRKIIRKLRSKAGLIKFWRRYPFWAWFLSWKDRLHRNFVDTKVKKLHTQLIKLLKQQNQEWNAPVYCGGYFYQGLEKIGIGGIKPTEKRFERYEIMPLMLPDMDVLDIGSNNGFVCCHLAPVVNSVVGVELNPYLVKIAQATLDFLDINNVEISQSDFTIYRSDKQFDVIFSLSNHHTIDGNLDMNFESYIERIHGMLKKDGLLVFESHDINGDDSDLEYKFELASQFFALEQHKMVAAFYPPDIDKLFAIFRKRPVRQNITDSDFELDECRHRYHYKESLSTHSSAGQDQY